MDYDLIVNLGAAGAGCAILVLAILVLFAGRREELKERNELWDMVKDTYEHGGVKSNG